VDQGLDVGGATGAEVGTADGGGESVGLVGGGVVVVGGVVGAGGVVVVVGSVVCVGTLVGVVVGLRVGFWLASVVRAAESNPLGRDRDTSVAESRAGGGDGGGVAAGGTAAAVISASPPPSRDDGPDRVGMPPPDSWRTPETAASAEPPISMAAVAPPMIIGGRRNIERAARCLPMYRIASPLVERVRLVLPCPKTPEPRDVIALRPDWR
jgi:hypothetical protein